MTEQQLDRPQVRACLEQVNSKGMAQRVWRNLLCDVAVAPRNVSTTLRQVLANTNPLRPRLAGLARRG
jgi:hypothetical protein